MREWCTTVLARMSRLGYCYWSNTSVNRKVYKIWRWKLGKENKVEYRIMHDVWYFDTVLVTIIS